MSFSAQKLTDRQSEILQYIQSCRIPPTVREIGAAFDIQSPNGVMCHLKALEKKGYITRDRRLSRGITLISGIRDFQLDSMLISIDEEHDRVTITFGSSNCQESEVPRMTFAKGNPVPLEFTPDWNHGSHQEQVESFAQ